MRREGGGGALHLLPRADCSNADRPGAVPQHNGLTAFGKVGTGFIARITVISSSFILSITIISIVEIIAKMTDMWDVPQ